MPFSRIVECFIDRADNELPQGFNLFLSLENRCVELHHFGRVIQVFTFDRIESSQIGTLLDFTASLCNNYLYERRAMEHGNRVATPTTVVPQV